MTIQYDPQKVTDWLTPLEKVYARQSQQLDRYHQQLRERDRQEEAATLNLPEMFSKLAGFSQTISQVVEARKSVQDEKNINRWLQYDANQVTTISNQFKELDKENLKDHKAFQKQVGTLEDSWVKKELSGLAPREIIELKKFILKEKLKYKTFQDFQKDDDYVLKGWDKLGWEEQDAEFENWLKKDFGHLAGKEGIVFSSVAPEIQRMVDTRRTTTKSKTKQKALAAEELNFETKLISFANSPDTHDVITFWEGQLATRAATYTNIPNGKTAIQQATDSMVADVWHMIDKGKLGMTELNKLFTGPLEGHPAGSTIPEAFFDKKGEIYTLLTDKALASGKARVDYEFAQGEAKAIALLDNASNMSQEEFNRQALALKSITSEKTQSKLNNYSVLSQTEEVYQDVVDEYNKKNILTGGNLIAHEAEIKEEKNDQFRTEQLARIKHHKERREQLGYPSDDEAFVKARIKQAFKLTLGDDEELTGKLRDLQIHLVQKLRKGFQDQIETPDFKPIIDRNSWTLANDEFENYVVKNGIDVTATKKADKGEGIFSSDGQGRLLNWKPFAKDRVDAIKEFNTKFDTTAIKKYDKEIFNAFNEAKNNSETKKGLTSFDRVLNEPESLATKEDLLGFFSQGVVSKELVYKARRLGIPAKTLIRRQLEALKDSGLYDDYLKLHGLDKVDFPESADETLDSILTKSGNRDLLYNFNRGYTSPKINQRIIKAYTESFNKAGLQDGTQIQLKKEAEEFGNTQAGKAVEALSNK
jgi:hypothetical protein